MSKTTCKALIKDYCANCTFAGVHFIADDTKHWTERLLWASLVVLSWYGSALLIIAAWEAFVQSPISFGVETTYIDWDTKLPTVAICETSNDAKIFNVSDTIWPLDHLLDLEDALKDIAYFRGMYTLGEDEVPSITTLQSSLLKIQLGNYYRRHLTVRNIENDPLIVETTASQRACRFHHENEGGLYPHYSYSACTVLCRKRGQMNVCKCNDHFMLGTKESEICNISGIACLHAHASQLTTLKPHWATKPGLACDCLPSCDETEITVIKDVIISSKHKANKKNAHVEMLLAYLPTERFKRNVVRSRLDLVGKDPYIFILLKTNT
ncbi:hypothetical protein O3G_MSEX003032 [Manduca sexta]|uniref:Uncharacterized protein n=1 Tax=Manduca sexta TaxID=7130 RepID=A0A922CF89_MANSE|nr:hypothetical protein O3G_MSEX003032 [Manduca sexta]